MWGCLGNRTSHGNHDLDHTLAGLFWELWGALAFSHQIVVYVNLVEVLLLGSDRKVLIIASLLVLYSSA